MFECLSIERKLIVVERLRKMGLKGAMGNRIWDLG